MARCSAPWSESVRPRKSQTRRIAVSARPTPSPAASGRKTNPKGRTRAPPRIARSRSRATPVLRKRGERAAPSRASPRTSGSRRQRRVRARHPAFAQGAVAPGESPVALAHDHDAVRPGHSPQTGKRRDCVSRSEERRGGLHAPTVPKGRPARKGRTACFGASSVLVAPAAEKAENHKDENDDQDDPENAHVPPLAWLRAFFPLAGGANQGAKSRVARLPACRPARTSSRR